MHGELENNASIRQLTVDLVQGIKRTIETDIESEVFACNPLELDDWQCEFDSYLSSMGIDFGNRIRYLTKYVSGAARECINGQFLYAQRKATFKLDVN